MAGINLSNNIIEQTDKKAPNSNGKDQNHPKPFRAKIWHLLNQPFTIFLMSSIVITGITTLYQYRDQKAAEIYERKNHALQMGYELGHRAAVGKRMFRFLDGISGPNMMNLTNTELQEIIEKLALIERQFASVCLFPNFQNWHYEALLRAVFIQAELDDSRKHYDETITTAMNGLKW